MSRVHVNNYSSTLNGAINNSVTTIVVTSATGLPTLTGSDFYNLTLVNGTTIEIVKVTARTGTSLTVTRAQEGTSAVSWANGSVISLRATADSLDRKMELTGGIGTGVFDFGGADSLEIPNSAAPTVNADGEIALDTTITSHKGLVKYYSGEEMVIPALPIANLTTTDGHVVAYDAATSAFKMAAASTGSLNNIVEDLTPQLGGDLDVNGKNIVSVTNGNINIKPDGTGAINLGGNATQPVEVRLLEDSINGTNYVGFKAPSAITANKVWQLPSADGTTGQALTTDGSGNLAFSTVAAGGTSYGSLSLIGTATASSSATLTFTGLTNYAYIVFVLNDILSATTTRHLAMRTSTDNGVTYDSGSNYLYAYEGRNSNGTTQFADSTGTTAIDLYPNLASDASGGASGQIHLYNPTGTGFTKLSWQMTTVSGASGQTTEIAGSGNHYVAADVDAVQFFMLTDGNIASGSIYAYGLLKSGATSSGLNDGDFGDVTVSGSGTSITIDTPTLATVATDDKVLIKDTSATDAMKYVTAQSIADLNTVLSFKTISVSGQSDVVADTVADTLTLAAGSNITITTNAGTDTVTIAASGGGGGGVDAYTTTATAAGTTTLTSSSNYQQYFTGSTTQTVVMPVTSTLSLGYSWRIVNNSTGVVTVQSSGANTIIAMPASTEAILTCILTSGTTAASWDYQIQTTNSTTTGSGSLVRATSPTLVTPVLGTPTSGALDNCTGFDWEFISSATASSSATIDFTGLSSTYIAYQVIAVNVIPVTDNTNLWIRLGTGATPTWDAGNNYSYSEVYENEGAASGFFQEAGVSYVNIANGAGNAVHENVNGKIVFYNPSQGSVYHTFNYETASVNSATLSIFYNGQGVYKSDTAVTAIRFLFSSGSISSGKFILFGLKAS